jgi:hypothetical protein
VRGPLNDLPGFSPATYGPRAFDKAALRDASSIRLTAGSALFVPGGEWHRTSSVGEEGSCSVSFLFEPDSWLKVVLRGLVSALVEDEAWREPALRIASPGRPRGDVRARLGEQLERLRARLARLDTDEVLERAYDSYLASVADERELFQLDPSVRAGLDQRVDGRWCLSVATDPAGIEVEVAEALVAACRWILASEAVPFSASAILFATVTAPHSSAPEHVERVVALLSVLETLGVLVRCAS